MFQILIDFATRNRNALTNCKRNASFSKKNLPHHHFKKFDDYREVLVKNLQLESNIATRVLYTQQSIFSIPLKRVAKQCQLCQELQIDPTTLPKNAELLQWPPSTLRHRVLLLREMGVSYMHAANVSNYFASISMRVGLFKAFMGIPKSVNIADNLLQCLHKPPDSVAPLEALSENLTVNNYHKQCLRWYIQWRLNVSKEDTTTVNQLLPTLQHRSFRQMANLFDTLHDDIGLTIDQIKHHRCLSAGSSDDLSRIISEISTFGSVGFRKLIQCYPALHAMEYDNVVEVIDLLKRHGFTNEAMSHCPEILLMESSEVASRLETLDATPELRVLKNSINALMLIRKFGVAQIRVDYLRYLNIKNTTVRALTGEARNFERFVRTGVDYTKGKEIGYSLEKSLKLGMREIRRRIQKHSYWRHVDLVSMHDSLEFLLERFELKDLHDNLQLVLYPREKIAETLQNLPELNGESNKRSCYTPKQIMAICLYEMERDHHFTGDGVWKYDATPPKRRKSSTDRNESEMSDFSDSETGEIEETKDSSKDSMQTELRKPISHSFVNKNVNT